MVALNKMWLLPLETKETLKSGKTQMQVGHVNSFGPGHIEDGLLLQFRGKLTSYEIQKSSKQLSFARIVISITSKEYSFTLSGIHFSKQYIH